MILQSEHLTMLGLGIKNDENVVDGNHLRWFFDHTLGFPKHGFELYKIRLGKDFLPGLARLPDLTEYLASVTKTFDFSIIAEGSYPAHPSPFLAGELSIESNNDVVIAKRDHHKGILLSHYTPNNQKYLKIHFPKVVNIINLDVYSHGKAYLTIIYYFKSEPFYKETIELTPGTQKIEISVDAIDCIQLIFSTESEKLHIPPPLGKIKLPSIKKEGLSLLPAGKIKLPSIKKEGFAVLEKISWIYISDYAFEKVLIARFNLPMDWATATSRLDEKKRSSGGYDIRTFEEKLKPYLEELVKVSPLPQYKRVRRENIEKASFENTKDLQPVETRPLQMVLLSALDPGTAQMLGLYYVHTSVVEKEVCNYMIVGRWAPKTDEDLLSIDFSRAEHQDLFKLKVDGFEFSSITPLLEHTRTLHIEDNLDRTPGRELKRPRKTDLYIEEDLNIIFPRPMSWIKFKLSAPSRVIVRMGDGSSISKTDVEFEFRDYHKGILSVKILGRSFHLWEFYYGEMDYAWITFNVEMSEKPPLPPPEGLKLYLLPGKSIVKRDNNKSIIYAPATVGLKWNLPPLSIRSVNNHVFYEIERQSLGANKNPEPIDHRRFVSVNNKKTIFVPRLPKKEDGTRDIPEFPPEWPRQTEEEEKEGIMPIFYIDAGDKDTEGLLRTPLITPPEYENRWYAYRIIGIDLFGRHSIPSNTETILVADIFPPPPPLALSAKFLDPKDPYLVKEEKEWVANADTGNGETAVWDNDRGWVAAVENTEGRRVPVGKENRKGFRVVWRWPESLQIQAPNAEKFRIYFYKGLPNVTSGKVHGVNCLKDSVNKGLHLKGRIENVNETANEITMNIETENTITIDNTIKIQDNTSDRFFKYNGNFFDITEIKPSEYDAENKTQRITFTINRETEFRTGEPIILEIPKAGILLRGTVTGVDSADKITISISSKTELKIPYNEGIKRFIRYDNRRLKVTNILTTTWDNSTKVLTVILTVDNPTQIKVGTYGIFDVDYSTVKVYFAEEINIQKNSFVGEVLRQRGKNFVIIRNESSSDGPETTAIFTVQNLTLPPREIPEVNKPASLRISPGNPLYTDYGNPNNWRTDGWRGIEIYMDEEKLRERIEEKIMNDLGQEQTISYIPFNEYILEDSLPERYHLSPTAQEPMVSEYIGITTVDKSGNESRVSSPLPVFAVLREKPPTPSTPSTPDIPVLWATIPDYYSISHFDVKWPVTEKAYFYQVYRTMDKTLILVDAEEHKNGHHPINTDIINEIRGGQPEIERDLQILDGKILQWRDTQEDKKQRMLKELTESYTNLRNDTWKYLASLPENEAAFTPVSEPLDPNNLENLSDDNTMLYKDSIQGRGRNRYFYRIGIMDKVGNRSSLSYATAPVCVPDVTLPKPPVITKVLSGNREAIIRWRKNTEPNMVRYEIYRTNRKEESTDVRLMGEPIAVINADAEGIPLRARVIKSSNNVGNALGYLDVSFVPNAKYVTEVYEINESGERVSGENYFGGFKSLIIKVSIDTGSVDVDYTNIDNQPLRRPGVSVVKGQVKIETLSGESPIKNITGIYKREDTSHSENIYEGISSGEIVLRGGDIVSLKGKNMAVSYADTERNPQRVKKIPYELEYIDNNLEAGTHYYRIIAVNEGQIGHNETKEFSSHPTKPITATIYDANPPAPPHLEKAEKVRIDKTGRIIYDTELGPTTGIYPAILIEWSATQPGIKCLVQREEEKGGSWISVSQWLKPEYNKTDKKWTWTFLDKTVREDIKYYYRIKLVNTSGKTTIFPEGDEGISTEWR